MTTFADLEQLKTDLLDTIAGWSASRLAYRSTPAEWSANQVFDHLARTEIEIFAAAKRNLASPHRIGLRDRLGYVFIERVFRTDRQVKTPASASRVLPSADPVLEDVIARWNESRLDLAQTIAQLTPEQSVAGIFRHPVAGWMDVSRILGFFAVHIIHHRFQLDRIGSATAHLA